VVRSLLVIEHYVQQDGVLLWIVLKNGVFAVVGRWKKALLVTTRMVPSPKVRGLKGGQQMNTDLVSGLIIEDGYQWKRTAAGTVASLNTMRRNIRSTTVRPNQTTYF
jgi:hypothetical protein